MTNLHNKSKNELIEEINKLNTLISGLKQDKKVSEFKQSNEKFKFFYFNAPFPYQTLDTNGNIRDVNQSWLETLGYDKEEVTGKWFGYFLRPDYVDAFKTNFNKLKKQGSIKDIHYYIRKKDNTFIYISFNGNSIFSAEGKFIETCCAFRDITKQKETEERITESEKKIKESESNLNILLNNRKEAIWSIDKDFNYVIFNNSFAETYNKTYKTEIKRGMKAVEVLNDELKGFWLPKYKKVLSGKRLEFEFQTKINNKIETFEIRLNPIFSDKKISGLSAISKNITEQKQIEKKNKESEEHFKILTESAGDSVFLADLETDQIIYVNKYACRKTGYSKDEILKFKIPDLDPFGFLKNKIENLSKNAGKDNFLTIDSFYKNKRGDLYPIEIRVAIINYRGKKAVLGIARDITERKEAENALIENEKAFMNLLENHFDAIAVVNKRANLVFINSMFSKITGYNKEELKKLSGWKFILKKDADVIKRKIKELYYSKNTGMYLESVFIKKNGDKIPVEITLSLTKWMGKSSPMFFVRDISERVKSEKLLKESEERYRNLLENLSVGVVVHQEHKIVYLNRKGLEIMNAEKPSDIVNQSIFQFIPPQDTQRILSQIKKTINGKKHFEPIETEYIGFKRQVVQVEISALPVMYNNKPAVLIIASDISVRKKAEEKIKKYQNHLEELVRERTAEIEENNIKISNSQKAMRFLLEDVNEARKDLLTKNNELLQANKDLEAFAYTVSHDLKSPLRAVSGYANVLYEDFFENFNDELIEYLRMIIKNAQKMDTLINDLLRFARVGKTDLDRSDFNLSILVEDVYKDITEIFPNRLTELQAQKDIYINADIGSMKQVIFNLLSNALKFSKKEELNKILFDAKEKDGVKTYFIKDSGIGFDMQHHDTIFSSFKRLHSADEYNGTGIGLSLVKRIVEKHNGKIYAESEPGKGSTFYFTVTEADSENK